MLAATLVSLATRAALQAAADGRAPRVCVAASRLGALQWLLQARCASSALARHPPISLNSL